MGVGCSQPDCTHASGSAPRESRELRADGQWGGRWVGHSGEEPCGDTAGLSPTAFPPGGQAGPAVPSALR